MTNRTVVRLAGRALCLAGLWSSECLATRIAGSVSFDGRLFNGWVSISKVHSPPELDGKLMSTLVANGKLSVDVPDDAETNQIALYRVRYLGRNIDSWEIWSVPASQTPLSRMNVVIASPGTNPRGWSRSTYVAESGIAGLLSDLRIRPITGPGFAVAVAATINANGQLEGVVGDPDECVLVDGTAKPCTQESNFAAPETPSGVTDGSNATFVLADIPYATSLMLFRNGLFMTPGFDYTLSDQTITFVAGAIPQSGDTLTATYKIDSTTRGLKRQSKHSVLLCDAIGVLVRTRGAQESEASCTVPASVIGDHDQLLLVFVLSGLESVSTGVSLTMNEEVIWSEHFENARGHVHGPIQLGNRFAAQQIGDFIRLHLKAYSETASSPLILIESMQISSAPAGTSK